MNYANLISAMSAVIKANGNNEITGNLLQQVLRAIINSLGQGYQFMGVATTATDPGTQDARLFYFAEGPGTYSNFGPLTVPDDGQVYLLVLGSSWAAVQLPIPTFAGFSDLVTEVAGKMALVPTATEGHVAEFGNAGQVRDGGVQTSALARRDAGAVVGNLAEFDGNGDPKDSGIAAEDVMKIPAGLMPFGPAGLAEALLDTDSAGNVQEFSLRKSGGDGGAYFRRLLGNSVVFNQIYTNGNFAQNTGWNVGNGGALAIADNIARVTKTATGSVTYATLGQSPTKPAVAWHKYLLVATVKTVDCKFCFVPTGTSADGQSAVVDCPVWTRVSYVWTCPSSGNKGFQMRVLNPDDPNKDLDLSVKDAICFDLTEIYGAGNEPTTYAEFCTRYYLPYYNPGKKLIHNKVAKVITRGANQWDEVLERYSYNQTTGEKQEVGNTVRSANKIRVFPGESYYFRIGELQNKGIRIFKYGANGEYIGTEALTVSGSYTIPADTYYLAWQISEVNYSLPYKNDICINISDADINGQYFPYWERELALDITNQEDTDGNKPFAEGAKSCPVASDEFNEVGGIVRVGVRAYQASDDTDASVITDGVDTAYALTTPVPFTWKEPLNTGIKVSKYGTEEITPAQTENIDNAPFRAVTTYSISVANLIAALSALGNRGGAKGALGGGNPGNGEEPAPEEESPKEEEAPKEEIDPIEVETPTPEVQSKR